MERKRITVKQFRAMGEDEAFMFWMSSQWPFDRAIGCAACLKMHSSSFYCDIQAHAKLRNVVGSMAGVRDTETVPWLKRNAPALFALRKKFDKLYRAPRRRPEGR